MKKNIGCCFVIIFYLMSSSNSTQAGTVLLERLISYFTLYSCTQKYANDNGYTLKSRSSPVKENPLIDLANIDQAKDEAHTPETKNLQPKNLCLNKAPSDTKYPMGALLCYLANN